MSDLEKKLSAALKPDGSLPLSGTLVGSPDLSALLGRYFKNGTLQISPRAGTPLLSSSADGKGVVVTGTVSYRKLDACDLKATLTPEPDGSVSLVLYITLGDGWTMADLFPDLLDATVKNLSITGASLVLLSREREDPTYKVKLDKGLNLVGTLQVADSMASVAPLLGRRKTLTVCGPITDANVPIFTLRTETFAAKLAKAQITECRLTFAATDLTEQPSPGHDGPRDIAESGTQPIGYAQTSLQGTLSAGKDKDADIRAFLQSDSDWLSLTADFDNVHITDFAELQPFIGAGTDLWGALPKEIGHAVTETGNPFLLKQIAVGFDIEGRRFSHAKVLISVDLGGVGLFDAIPALRIEVLEVGWTLWHGRRASRPSFQAEAEVSIDQTYKVWLAFQTEPGDGYRISVRQDPESRLKLTDLVTSFLPGMDFLPALDLADFSIVLSPRQKQYALSAVIEGSWDVLSELGISLEEIELSAFHDGNSKPPLSGSIEGLFRLPLGKGKSKQEVEIHVEAKRPPGSKAWRFEGFTGRDQLIPIGDLVAGLVKKLGVSGAVPEVIGEAVIENLFFSYDSETKELVFAGESQLEIEGQAVTLVVSIDVNRAEKSLKVGGLVRVGKYAFDLIFEQSSGQAVGEGGAPAAKSSTLLGTFKHPVRVDLRALISEISPDVGDLIPSVELATKAMLFAYRKQRAKSSYLFSLALGIDLGLSSLPLVGKALPPQQSLQLTLQPIVGPKAKDSGEAIDWSALLDLLPDDAPRIPESYGGGFELLSTLRMGELVEELSLGAQQSDLPTAAQESPGAVGADGGGGDPSAAVASNPSTTWIDLQKHFGPLHFQRVGIGYHDGKIDALLDAALSVAPLTIALNGLGAHYEIAKKHISFSLDGLGIEFQRGPLEIGGAFLRLMYKGPDGEEHKDYAGKLSVHTEAFAIGALGAYSDFEGHPSLFVYAFLDKPMGGPAFFFVEGLALGFGMNRRLSMPPIDQVHSFPLVAEVMGGASGAPHGRGDQGDAIAALTTELSRLEAYVSPQLGEFFLAVGVKFNSFKQVDSFAMLSLAFGKHFELDLLGLSTLKVPSESDEILAEIQLQLLARFVPEEGFLGVQAQLSPESYILSKACHLQGGFAFFSWFSGRHDGDFVTTLGGYHPHYRVPAHYPQRLPRLGFNWHYDEHTQIKGSAYYALTASMFMAGGALQATWHDGDLGAWIKLGADFLIQWKPFHYEADAYVDIAAEATIHFFGTHHISFEVGADVNIWGPEFAGTAHVHISVVSFTVSFGPGRHKPDPIPWAQFKASFLPEDGKVCNITARRGLLRTLKEGAGKERWVVNAKDLCIAIDSMIPSRRGGYLDLRDAEKTSWDRPPPKIGASDADAWRKLHEEHIAHPEATRSKDFAELDDHGDAGSLSAFGIDPMGKTPDELQSHQVIRVVRVERKGNTKRILKNVSLEFVGVPIVKKVPAALWNPDAARDSRPNLDKESTIDAVTGYELHPAKPPAPGTSCFIEDGQLQYEVTPRDLAATSTRTIGYKAATNRSADFGAAFGEAKADKRRADLLSDLGFVPATDLRLSESLPEAFVQPPRVAATAESST